MIQETTCNGETEKLVSLLNVQRGYIPENRDIGNVMSSSSKTRKMMIKFRTSNLVEGTWNLLTPENLAKVNVKLEDIKRIESFFKVPGKLYSEPGVASDIHPTGGSVGVWLYTDTGDRASIQDIIYHDPNINKTHYDGLPHWNHERRYIDTKGKEWREGKCIEYHTIEDSETIHLSFQGNEETVRKEAA